MSLLEGQLTSLRKQADIMMARACRDPRVAPGRAVHGYSLCLKLRALQDFAECHATNKDPGRSASRRWQYVEIKTD